MGNCATKPKVLKDSEEDLKPVEQESAHPTGERTVVFPSPKATAEEKTPEDAAAAARRSEKGKDILIEEDDVNVNVDNNKRQSLSLLFHEDKPVEKEVTKKPDTSASSEVSKVDTSSDLRATNDKAQDTYDVETRTDLEVKVTSDPKVKTPETPTAQGAEDQKANFSENWDVKFPEELEHKKSPEAVKFEQEAKLPEVSEVSATDLSEIKVSKELDATPVVLEEKKNVPEVRTDEVKAAESELLKVSEVKSSEDLDVKVPKVIEPKTPETSNVKVTDNESEVKNDKEKDQEAAIVKIVEEAEFVDAQEKIEKSDQDKENVLTKTEEKEKK